jgi:hypothetical protein
MSLYVRFSFIESRVAGWALLTVPSIRDQAAAARWP